MMLYGSFLAGAILTLVMPVTLLLILWFWYWYTAKRFGPAGRTPDAPAAAGGGQTPGGAGGAGTQPPGTAV